MYVILEAQRTVSLPYSLPNGLTFYFAFVPGRNHIGDDVWDSIVEQNKKDFRNHYFKVLYPFETRFDTGQREHLNHYPEEEMLEIIGVIKDVGFLESLLDSERNRRIEYAPRSIIVEALNKRIKDVWAGLSDDETDIDKLNHLGDAYRNYVIDDEDGLRQRAKMADTLASK